MENSIAKSLGYESEEEFQDGIMLDSDDLNKRYNEVLEKERQLAKEQVKVEFAEELKKKNEEEAKSETDESSEQPPAVDGKETDSVEVETLRKQVEEMQEKLAKIDKYSTTAKSQSQGGVGKVDTGDGRPDAEPDNRFITKMMPYRNEFR